MCDLSRSEIIESLASTFGSHLAYDPQTRQYVESGRNEDGTCSVARRASDGGMSIHILTYGEIADAILDKMRQE